MSAASAKCSCLTIVYFGISFFSAFCYLVSWSSLIQKSFVQGLFASVAPYVVVTLVFLIRPQRSFSLVSKALDDLMKRMSWRDSIWKLLMLKGISCFRNWSRPRTRSWSRSRRRASTAAVAASAAAMRSPRSRPSRRPLPSERPSRRLAVDHLALVWTLRKTFRIDQSVSRNCRKLPIDVTK